MPSTQFEVAELSEGKNSLNHTTSSRAGTLQEECLVASQYVAGTPSAYGFPLLIKGLLESGVTRDPEQEIVSADCTRLTYRQFAERVGRLASGLASLGVERGDTVAIMDWDTHRYLECFFAVPMMDAALGSVASLEA
jgi:fatty-acyl-CoA synthase